MRGAPALGPEWPALSAGDVVTVHDSQAWEWTVRLVEDATDDSAPVEIVDGPEALPMPELSEPEADGSVWIQLPNMSGHAHVRSWRAGDIVRAHGRAWKVRGKPRPTNPSYSHLAYRLVPVDEKQWATRPGRVPFPNEMQARAAVGTAVEVDGEWLHVKKIERRAFHSAAGRGYVFTGIGRFVPQEKAQKINDKHPPNRLSRAIAEGESQGRGWQRPERAKILAVERRTDMVSPDYMVADGKEVYLVDPVYDDDSRVTKLRLTVAQATKLARDLGWEVAYS